MSYHPKVLKGLVRPIKKHIIHSFDTETCNNNKVFLLCGYDDGTRVRHYYNRTQAIKGMNEHMKKGVILFATNLNFDYAALFYGLEAFSQGKIIMRNGDIITAKYENMVMADTNNFCNPRLSVEAMGKAIGIYKMNRPRFLGKYPKNSNQWKYLRDYNGRDCKVTRIFMERLQESFNKLGAEMKMAIASTAMDLYRRKYMPCDIWKEHDYQDIKKMIFESYYGGRVECFRRGKLPRNILNYYDINSLYPSVMIKTYPKPNSCKIIRKNKNIDNILSYEGITDAEVEVGYMEYPILPYREDKKLLFPIGRFRGVWTHAELSYAIRHGYRIRKIYRQIIYTKRFYPFKKYVKTLYNLRMRYKAEDNEFMSNTCKLLLNSLYGKFATKEMTDIDIIDGNLSLEMTEKEFDKITGRYAMKAKILNPQCYKDFIFIKTEKQDTDRNYIIPIFASYTTAYGRIKLHKLLARHKAYYCDTDSIITPDKIKPDMKLGGLKLEMEIKSGVIIRPKNYSLIGKRYAETKDKKDKKLRIKGAIRPHNKDLKKILEGKMIRQEKFMKLRESFNRGFTPNEIVKFKKFFGLEDDKRIWPKSFDKKELQSSKPIHL